MIHPTARERAWAAYKKWLYGPHTMAEVIEQEIIAAEAAARADEGEECADTCDSLASIEGIAQKCAAAIRARAEPKEER